MGVYEERVLPRLVEVTCGGQEMERWRRRATEGLHGTVVEIGFGSGLNLPAYPQEVTRVLAVEPSELARERSRRHQGHEALRVDHVGLDGESLPLPDDACDGALATFTLCTIPRPEVALAELRRVLRPGGRFHFLEHGRSPDERVRRWQHRFEPVQRRVAGGCHLTRDGLAMGTEAGFTVEQVQSRYAKGPKPWTWFTVGAAVSAD